MAGIIADQMSPDLFAGVQGSGTNNSQSSGDDQKKTAPATFNWTTGNSQGQGQSQAPYPTFNWTTGNSQSQTPAPSNSSSGTSVNDSAFVTGGSGVSPASSGQAGSPTQWNVTTPQTVQGQMTNLMDMNNPIIQQAMTQAKQQQVANGTLNSSMAATAGLNAAYNTVLPIATADAGTNAKASSYNADAANQVNLANAQLQNQTNIANLNSQTSLQTAGMNNQTQLATANLSADTQKQLANLDNTTKVSLQKLANDNQVLFNTNSQAASLFSNATSALNNIAMSTTMDAGSKQQASAQVWGNLQAQIKVLSGTSKLDLSSILGVGTSSNPYITPEPTVDQLKDKTKSPGPGYVWDEGQQSWVKVASTPTSAPAPTNTAEQGGR